MLKDATMPIFSPDRHACAPSYVKLTKQPITGGAYRPLANDKDSNACAPSALSGHHGSKLYTQKSAIHAIFDNASVFIPKVDAPHLPKTTDDKSIDEAINEAANDSTHSVPPSTEIQLTQANEHPLMQAIEVCKQSVHTTAKALSTAGHAVAKAAKTTGHAIRTAATAVKTAWQTFTNFKAIQLIIKFFKKVYALWKKRMRFSYAFYTIVFFLLTSAEVIFLQWGMYSEPEYEKGTEIDETTKVLQSVGGQVTRFISQMWLEQKNVCLVSFMGLALIYLALIFVTNRFWIATLVFGVALTAFGVANSIKVQLRNEPIIPADLTFISGGDTGSIMSFVPKSSQTFVNGAITFVIWFAIIIFALFALDGRRRFIYCSWRHPIANIKNIIGNVFRILAAILSVVLLSTYVIGLGTPGSGTYKWAKDNGYEPQLWNAIGDAQANNPATTFLSLSKVKAMDKPDNYSQKTMESLAKKYAKEAQAINQTRPNKLTDNTVIMILSETFSDPTRVPGVSFTLDPIPNIRNVKNTTTSGLMLSPGYGGGTANIEYQALTGLNLANFNDSLIVPYQQLVPNQNNPYSFNQIWMEKYGKNASTAVHPFQQSMYLRNINYRKFGFSYLYTLDSKVPLEHTGCIDRSPYVSDSEAYQSILDLLDKQQDSNSSQFLQLVTMQNHLPYGDYYDNNEFLDANISEDLSDGERWNINTYTKGINWTDQETADFLNQLDQIDKPITVIFYGDHLPGIYDTADMDKNNKTVLHETDYFIWSNSVSTSHDTKVNPITTAYTSSNYFMPLAAEHMNAKVSPYLAMLTELQQEVPAMSRMIGTNGGIGQGKATYLDHAGNNIKAAALSAKAKGLLKDYKLVQYDQTVGKNYLEGLDFTQVP
ncbi:LTA synthase family protein [Bifidobacterium pseudocatenulatum]|uniref:LTA synthase family protein n=2 Tax=Bifidobacterium pseudocatenulatum TaxID=28026 RepID=UPI001D011EFC|nr:LTA synthase family protein [Bifidobacterium pseudocatenulatum]